MFIPPGEYAKYVTHVIYLKGRGTPRVDGEELRRWGIVGVGVEGVGLEGKKGLVYDVGRLREVLRGIIYGV